MKIGYSKGLAITLLVLGFIVIGLRLVLMSMGGGRSAGAMNLVHMIPGIVCVIIGFAYQVKPHFTIGDGEVVFRAPIGPAKKRYPYQPGELSVQNNALYVGSKKTGARRWMANKADWDRMVQWIESPETFA